MDLKVVFVLGFLFLAGLAAAKPSESDEFANEFEEIPNDEIKTEEKEEVKETSNDEEEKAIMEDMEAQTSTALELQNDPDTEKHKGFCHWGVAIWYKPGVAIRCSCMKCVCQKGGNWACAYEFAYCPYYYCGNQLYNPYTQICCCGKVHSKKANYSCCGYFYYDSRYYQCCKYFSVKPKKSKCPRFKI